METTFNLSTTPPASVAPAFAHNHGTNMLTLPTEMRLAIYDECDGQTMLSLSRTCRTIFIELPVSSFGHKLWFILKEPTPLHCPKYNPSWLHHHGTYPSWFDWLYPSNGLSAISGLRHVQNLIIEVRHWMRSLQFFTHLRSAMLDLWCNPEVVPREVYNRFAESVPPRSDYNRYNLKPVWEFAKLAFPNLKRVRVYGPLLVSVDELGRCEEFIIWRLVQTCPLDLNLTVVLRSEDNHCHVRALHEQAMELGDIRKPLTVPEDYIDSQEIKEEIKQYVFVRKFLMTRSENQASREGDEVPETHLFVRLQDQDQDGNYVKDSYFREAIYLPPRPAS